MESTKLKIRPYARLLTMLGEQLIKNEQIALAELIKNSYDADADWVEISFNNVVSNGQGEPKLIIEDNGTGMTLSGIKRNWMNPATPNKKSVDGEVRKTESGRIVQGEKGIGRFAILKLGRRIKIITRSKCSENEYVIEYDFSKYDRDFLSENGESKELFLDDINIEIKERPPQIFISPKSGVTNKTNQVTGTRIEISCLNSEWSKAKIDDVNKESQKLESLFDRMLNREQEQRKPFKIIFSIDGQRLLYSDETVKRLETLLEQYSVLKIKNGRYSEVKQEFTYDENGQSKVLSLSDPKVLALKIFRDRFAPGSTANSINLRKSACGNFGFNFFVFDLSADRNSPYFLDSQDKELVKEHRIYLYRDGIRVAPYGDPDNDWLETDKRRATGRTGDYLSNDQVVGFVDISKEGNPKLKDKTNREGLIEDGEATKDFIVLLHTFLLYIRKNPYQQYHQRVINIRNQQNQQQNKIQESFAELEDKIKGNSQALAAYKKVFRLYKKNELYNKRKLEITEDLAGVGLSVETASHDLMLMLINGLSKLDILMPKCLSEEIPKDDLFEELSSIRGMFSFVKDQMKNLELLFRSSRQRKHQIRVEDILNRVIQIYRHTLSREKITCQLEKIGSPIVAKTTDAVLLQVFINLFDNAIYWIDTVDSSERQIHISLNGDENRIVFSDSGPGIHPDDQPFIFEAFYSGKQDGRGLGLYIARQLLNRSNYSLRLLSNEDEKELSGANFEINFGDQNDGL